MSVWYAHHLDFAVFLSGSHLMHVSAPSKANESESYRNVFIGLSLWKIGVEDLVSF